MPIMRTELLSFALAISYVLGAVLPDYDTSTSFHTRHIADPTIQVPVNSDDDLFTADLRGFDISQPQSAEFWRCTFKEGYRKPVIRGYRQACGSVSICDPIEGLSSVEHD